MQYFKPENIIVDMTASPVFSEFGGRIYDIAPMKEPEEAFIVLSVISDPAVSEVQGRARLEVRILFPSSKPQFEARAYIQTLNSYFVLSKKFDGEEVYRIEAQEKQCFIDPDGRRVVLVDYYMYYIT